MRDYALVFGNDDPNERRALELCQSVSPYVDAVKIEIYGTPFIRKIKRTIDIPVISDAKLSNIGHLGRGTKQYDGTISKKVYKLADAGADFIIIQMFPGHLTIQEAVDAGNRRGVKILGLPKMTHEGSNVVYDHPIDRAHVKNTLHGYDINSLDGKIDECDTLGEYFVILGEYCDVHGFIGPANKPNFLRKMRRLTQKPIYATGLGRQWHKPRIPLREQMRETYSILDSNSGVILATEIWRASNPVQKAHEVSQWRDEIVLELIQ